jgi:hypothetical protein
MRKKRTLSGDIGLYFHTDAAELISDQSGHTEGRRKKLADDMFEAIHEGSLHAYDFHNGNLLTIPISPTTPLCVRPADVNDWLKEKTAYECRWNEPPQSPAPLPAATAEPRATPLLVLEAQKIAREIITRQRKRDLYPSQVNIADEIAQNFRKRGLHGTGGKPISSGTIKRWALKGITSQQVKQLSTAITRGKRGN